MKKNCCVLLSRKKGRQNPRTYLKSHHPTGCSRDQLAAMSSPQKVHLGWGRSTRCGLCLKGEGRGVENSDSGSLYDEIDEIEELLKKLTSQAIIDFWHF